jgi:DNA-binding transcriptional regulator/RsmH inhibitor MraZ
METTVEMDSKGRLLVPAEIRRNVKSRRFTLRTCEGRLELVPLPEPERVKGKHRGLLKVGLEELEKEQEKFIVEGRR